MKTISVLLADDHAIVREAFQCLISSQEDMCVVGAAEDGRRAVNLAKVLKPDVVLMDVAMPLMNGAVATKAILQQSPNTRILAVSSYTDEDTVSALMRAGASGYLVKHAAGSELLTGIREICKGRKFLSPQIPRREGYLTPRETEVLRCIGEGLSNKEMGTRLGISVKTVEKHRDQLMKKLKIRDAASLTRYAYSKGLIADQVSADVPLSPASATMSPASTKLLATVSQATSERTTRTVPIDRNT